ncbi:N-formylglutamate amidohydrolase [uncultured Litoreibacter sp.]|uniref:N-formylglutamate amidohydrolase n=1 Tax=uncultured Litoreibacter sp. TaxID=1392394 RepID=UPI002625AA35|nr:N-formylglutamate amidohydrolase [uncultured Litoreibacter sp.]
MTYHPFEISGADRAGQFVCLCDHAANTVPPFVAGGDLGLPPEDMNRHIAFDIGAAGVTRALAERLTGPAVLSNFSRLVIDPNRGEDDPTLVMRLYDGTIIPANKTVSAQDREHRLSTMYRPYHDAVAQVTAAQPDPVIVSVHSFTPQLRGRPARPWHVGVLYAGDRRMADPLLNRLRAEDDLCVGDNQPYSGHLTGDTMDKHALRHGRPHVLIEIRNDLISNEADQMAWADRLAPILTDTLAASGL